LAHYVERMGTGIQDIIKKCKDYGLPEPEFKMQAGFVAIIYRKKGIALSKIGGRKDLEKLSFRAKKILHLIRKKPGITQPELSKLVGINEKNIRVNINKLKLKGLLKRIGSSKSGYWEVKNYFSK